jgi:hypothetical protein
VNLYRYVDNSPNDRIDPSGLWWNIIIGGVVAGDVEGQQGIEAELNEVVPGFWNGPTDIVPTQEEMNWLLQDDPIFGPVTDEAQRRTNIIRRD